MKPPALRLQRLETRLTPAAATWDGGGTDNNWTTAANWVGDIAPAPGDGLLFPRGAARLTAVNDFPGGTAFHSLGSPPGQSTPAYQLSGNPIALAAGFSFQGDVGSLTTNPPVNDDCAISVGPLFFTGPKPAGTLTTGNLTMTAAASGATFFVAPGAGDRIAVRGSIRLGGGLEVFAQAGYTPHLGDRFTLIANDGTDLAVGEVAGAPAGGGAGRCGA